MKQPTSNIHRRGFASMSAEKRSEIASMGGKAAHAKGTARTFAPGAEARKAGAKGGNATAANRRAKSRGKQ